MISLARALWAVLCLSNFIAGQVGPFFPVVRSGAADVKFIKQFNYEFKHPGIWFSHEDLERVRINVENGEEPWATAWKDFLKNSRTSANYTMSTVMEEVSRGKVTNNAGLERDSWAALYNAIVWYVTKDEAHLNESASIIDAWGTTLQRYTGADRSLGTHGTLPLINAAEILKHETGWIKQGERWQGSQGFAGMVYGVLAPNVVGIGQANYGFAMIHSLMVISIYLEDAVMWNYAMNEYQNNVCGGIKGMIHPVTAQNSEAGRDQAHAQFGINVAFSAATVAWNQGHDLFAFEKDLLLRGAEYTARYNVNETVDYDPKYARCNNRLVAEPWPEISQTYRGRLDAFWYATDQFFSKVKKQRVPWQKKAAEADNLPYDPFTTLMYTR